MLFWLVVGLLLWYIERDFSFQAVDGNGASSTGPNQERFD